MKTLRLKSWHSFKIHVQKMFDEAAALRLESGFAFVSEPVFRGQSNAAWSLDTTLEREVENDMSFEDYYSHIFCPSLRHLRGILDFELPETPDLTVSMQELEVHFPLYEQLALLRHHGFPSPLLDWSSSPFVGAFFAFSPVPSPTTKAAAIFCYQEHLGAGKGFQGDKPHIRTFGPWSPVHERHVRQQSQYTVALREKNSRVTFCKHEDAIRERPFSWMRFDEVTQIVLPISIREEALRDLQRMNVTEYSLFGTEDALVRTVGRLATQKSQRA